MRELRVPSDRCYKENTLVLQYLPSGDILVGITSPTLIKEDAVVQICSFQGGGNSPEVFNALADLVNKLGTRV